MLAVLALPLPVAAGGLRCSVGEVVIENLKIGHTYSLAKLANLPLSVTSTDAQVIRVNIMPLRPDTSELRQGAEPIPDARWASATPDMLELEPGKTVASDMSLAIPNDPSLLGRRFQVGFWTHTMPREGEMVAHGLKSRVIFTIAPTPDDSEQQPTGDMSVTLQPAEVRLSGVAPGRDYRIESAGSSPLKVRNTSTHPVTVELKALGATASGGSLSAGDGELLSAAVVKIEPASFTLAPGEERPVTGTVSMERAKGLRGRNFMCIVSAAVVDQSVRTQIYSRLYVNAR